MIEKHVRLNLGSNEENENIIEYNIEEFDLSNEYEKLKLEALKQVNPATANMPLELDGGWVCLCGQYNSGNGIYCGKCRAEKSDVFECVKDENLENLISSYQQKSQEKEIKIKKMKEQALIIGIALGAAAILLTLLITNFCIMNSRRTFTSSENMRDALQGTWTCSSLKLKIDGDKGTNISGGKEGGSEDIKWHPIRGYFKHAGQKFIVKKDGTLKQNGNEYKKGSKSSSSSSKSGSSSKSNSYSGSKSSSYESKYTALKVSDIKVTSNSSYTVCTGTVTNTGKQKYTFVKVKGAFKDLKGKVLDTDSTYAAGSEGLAAGESTTFRMSVPKNVSIKTCTVTIMD